MHQCQTLVRIINAIKNTKILNNNTQRCDIMFQSAVQTDSEPSDALALIPLTLFRLTRGGRVEADAVLLAVRPLALVLAPVGPVEGPLARLLIVDVLAVVAAPVGPLEDPVALHLVILPHALVLTSVRPIVCAYKDR